MTMMMVMQKLAYERISTSLFPPFCSLTSKWSWLWCVLKFLHSKSHVGLQNRSIFVSYRIVSVLKTQNLYVHLFIAYFYTITHQFWPILLLPVPAISHLKLQCTSWLLQKLSRLFLNLFTELEWTTCDFVAQLYRATNLPRQTIAKQGWILT